ncbi:MAG: NAD-dependent protein deacylase [Candidatus Eremiobacteraeota bacterium]|nr:NAD-dependent protein deacylase [Candidatus Eremiobacteraeota bacterium]
MDTLRKASELIGRSRRICAFTGAGVSTESGIPDFRSSGGVFESLRKRYPFPPEEILSRDFFLKKPELFFEVYRKTLVYRGAKPNRCHTALAELENRGKLAGIVTQNIDNLHQEGGSHAVIELHGNANENQCTGCGKKFTLDYMADHPEVIPRCDGCRAIVRPLVVLYGECLEHENLVSAKRLIRSSDTLLIIGTSLVVYPAAALLSEFHGASMIIINKAETICDEAADVVIRESASKAMDAILEALGRGI